MHRFVSQPQEKRLGAFALEKSHGAVRQDVGGIAGGLDHLAVLVQFRIMVSSLTLEADPVIEAWTRRVVIAHVELADEASLVTGCVQRPRKSGERVTFL